MSPFDELTKFDLLVWDIQKLQEKNSETDIHSALQQISTYDQKYIERMTEAKRNLMSNENKRLKRWCAILFGFAVLYTLFYLADDPAVGKLIAHLKITRLLTEVYFGTFYSLRKAMVISGLQDFLAGEW